MNKERQTNHFCRGKFIHYMCMMIFSLLLFNSCASLWEGGYSEPQEKETYSSNLPSASGKCYAKCLMPDKYETFEEELLLYTGDDTDTEGVVLETIIFRHGTTEWVKKKDDNCRSSDPKDCMVWCLKEVPEITKDYYLVVDTTKVKEYELEVVSYEELTQAGGFSEWKEVVCESDISPKLYSDIQIALIELGYLKDVTPDGKISAKTKDALVRCQKENGLPIGSLDVVTLEFLEVEY